MEEWEVEVNGIHFLVRGEYVKGKTPSVASRAYSDDPGYGPYVEDYEIFVADSEIDIFEVLTQKTIDSILNKIVEEERT